MDMPLAPSEHQENSRSSSVEAGDQAAEVNTSDGDGGLQHAGLEDAVASGEDSVEPPMEPGKMFVGGLSWQTSQDALEKHFADFGDVKEAVVMKDPVTKRSRGFGFVTFKDPASVHNVLEVKEHKLDDKVIDPKIAIPRKQLVAKTKKLFIGGLSSATTEEQVREVFEKFGKVEEVVIMMDKQNSRPRGFGFVTFEEESSVDNICEKHYLEINGRMVEAKKAVPRDVMHPPSRHRSIRPYGGFAAAYPPYILEAYTMQALRGGSNRKGQQRHLPPSMAGQGLYFPNHYMDPRMRPSLYYDAMAFLRPMHMPMDRPGFNQFQSNFSGSGSSRFQQPLSPTGPAPQTTNDAPMPHPAITTMATPAGVHGYSAYGGGTSTSAAPLVSGMNQLSLNGHGQGSSAGFDHNSGSSPFTASYLGATPSTY